MAWRFGDFTLDEERRQLLRAGIPLSLEPKAYRASEPSPRPTTARALQGANSRRAVGRHLRFRVRPRRTGRRLAVRARRRRPPATLHPDRPWLWLCVLSARLAKMESLRVTPSWPVLRAAAALQLWANPNRSIVRSTAVTAALEEPAGAAVHVLEFARAHVLPLFFSSWPASPSQHRFCSRVLRSTSLVMAPMDEARVGVAGAWALSLRGDAQRPIEVFEVGRAGAFVSEAAARHEWRPARAQARRRGDAGLAAGVGSQLSRAR